MTHIIEKMRQSIVVLDSDAANEADDQFAIAYAALSPNISLDAVLAAPFTNSWMKDPARGASLSYDEIVKYLRFAGSDVPVYAGSKEYLKDTVTPVESPAADYIVKRIRALPEGESAVVCVIGAGTNVASALLKDPSISDKMIIVWQAGHVPECPEGGEFNLCNDVNAGHVIFGSHAPLVLIPAYGVSSVMGICARELRENIEGKSKVADELYKLFCGYVGVKETGGGEDAKKIVWDIASVGVLAGCGTKFVPSPRKCYADNGVYCEGDGELILCRDLDRDGICEDMYRCLGGV